MILGAGCLSEAKRNADDAGRAYFYEYVAAGCAQFFKGENDLSNLISLENGTIYISATETALHCYLFEAMGAFNEIYLNVHFKVLNNSTTDSVNAVKEGKVDFAFVSTNLQVMKPLKSRTLQSYQEILIGGISTRNLREEKFLYRSCPPIHGSVLQQRRLQENLRIIILKNTVCSFPRIWN